MNYGKVGQELASGKCRQEGALDSASIIQGFPSLDSRSNYLFLSTRVGIHNGFVDGALQLLFDKHIRVAMGDMRDSAKNLGRDPGDSNIA